MRKKIKLYLHRINYSITNSIARIYPFSLELTRIRFPTRIEFVNKFCEIDQTESKLYIEYIEHNRLKINLYIDFILSNQEYLTNSELDAILSMKDSSFINKPLIPTDYIYDNNVKIELPYGNQRETAESIYYIYEQINKILQ